MAEHPPPRVLLFTGKGGVGKTTLAAGTGVLSAEAGRRTLVMSTDPAHSLCDALDVAVPLGVPERIAERLWVQQIDAVQRLGESWSDIQGYLSSVLDAAGVDPMETGELLVLPGAEEVLALLEVRDRVNSGGFDTVILDCAPTAETLRLLALPDALEWYMRRIWPTERRVLAVLRAPLQKATGIPMPTSPVFDAVERLHRELSQVRQVLSSQNASVRLVTTPERVVIAESRRTHTTLALYGYRVDSLIANRLLPPTAEAWGEGWRRAQHEHVEQLQRDVAPVPVRTAAYTAVEPVGMQALRELAAQVYGDDDPFAPATGDPLFDVVADGADFVLVLALPLAVSGEVDIAERAGDLIITVGSHRRILALPGVLRRCVVAGAALADGTLRVRFRRNPDLWPENRGGGPRR